MNVEGKDLLLGCRLKRHLRRDALFSLIYIMKQRSFLSAKIMNQCDISKASPWRCLIYQLRIKKFVKSFLLQI